MYAGAPAYRAGWVIHEGGRARNTLGGHDQFATWQEGASETEFRATMHWPGDDERFADLNVFFVHTPARR